MKKLFIGILSVFMMMSQLVMTNVNALTKSPSKLGSVNLEGNADFKSDELFKEDAYDWNWLSTVDSRMVLLPNQNLNKNDFCLDFDLFVNKDDKKIRNFEQVKLNGNKATTIQCQWLPYKIQYSATYENKSTINMSEFFLDNNTFVRSYDIKDAKDKTINIVYNGEFLHGDTKDDVSVKSLPNNSLLLEGPDFYYVVKIMKLNADSSVTEILEPTIKDKKYSANIPVDSENMKIATSVTLAVKPDDNTSNTVIERANAITMGTNI